MCTPIEKFERAGFVARVFYDENPESPEAWDNIGSLAFDTRHASVNGKELPSDHWGTGRFSLEEDTSKHDGEALCKAYHGASHVLPVYAYDDRNGTVLEVAESWDQANGWIYATPESVQMTGVPEAAVIAGLERDLETWNQYLQGDVYGYEVVDQAGELVDSCWGFYGIEHAIEEAREALDTDVVRALEANPGLANVVVN